MDSKIEKLKTRLDGMSDKAVFYERMLLLEEAFKKFRYETAGKRYAKAFSHVLSNVTVDVLPCDRLAGRVQEVLLGQKEDESYNQICLKNNFQAVKLFSFEPLDQTTFSDPQYRYAPEWFNSWGHCQPDWEKILRVGVGGILREAEERLAISGMLPEQKDFLECCIISMEGFSKFIERYSKAAEKCAKVTTIEQESLETQQLSICLANIKQLPPQTFLEAVQLIWLINITLHTVCGARDYALGRMDKYLSSYYEKDIIDGKLTREQALLIIEDFCIKCNEIIGRGWEAGWEGHEPKRILSVNSIQYVMLGGVDIKGQDVTNEVSYLFLEAIEALKLKQPTVNVRWHEGIDKKFMKKACDIAASGLGYPSFYNDYNVMSALEDNGVFREDSVDYGYYGCNNSILSGKEDELREAWHNVPLYLELSMNEGKRFGSDYRIGVKTQKVDEIDTMEKLYAAMRIQIRNGIRVAKERIERSDAKWKEIKPFSFESVLMSDCIERMSSFNDNGSRYHHMNNHLVGLATVANSLYVVDRIVFKERRYTLAELVNILEKNWSGNELLRDIIKNDFPKYGSDEDCVDSFAVLASKMFIEELKAWGATNTGRRLYPSIYSLWHQRALGKAVNATPDGRCEGEQLSESQSPTYNTERKGPTATLNSIAKLPLNKTPTGGVNVKFQPSIFKNKGGDSLLMALILGFFKNGGMHLQINVVDNDELIDAKKRPEEHQNLLVRVVGYSAYFVTLSPEQQDEIIERTGLA